MRWGSTVGHFSKERTSCERPAPAFHEACAYHTWVRADVQVWTFAGDQLQPSSKLEKGVWSRRKETRTLSPGALHQQLKKLSFFFTQTQRKALHTCLIVLLLTS